MVDGGMIFEYNSSRFESTSHTCYRQQSEYSQVLFAFTNKELSGISAKLSFTNDEKYNQIRENN